MNVTKMFNGMLIFVITINVTLKTRKYIFNFKNNEICH